MAKKSWRRDGDFGSDDTIVADAEAASVVEAAAFAAGVEAPSEQLIALSVFSRGRNSRGAAIMGAFVGAMKRERKHAGKFSRTEWQREYDKFVSAER
jgi:hypothetical protein